MIRRANLIRASGVASCESRVAIAIILRGRVVCALVRFVRSYPLRRLAIGRALYLAVWRWARASQSRGSSGAKLDRLELGAPTGRTTSHYQEHDKS